LLRTILLAKRVDIIDRLACHCTITAQTFQGLCHLLVPKAIIFAAFNLEELRVCTSFDYLATMNAVGSSSASLLVIKPNKRGISILKARSPTRAIVSMIRQLNLDVSFRYDMLGSERVAFQISPPVARRFRTFSLTGFGVGVVSVSSSSSDSSTVANSRGSVSSSSGGVVH